MVLGPGPPPDDWLCWFSNNAHDQPEAVKVSANIRPIIFSIFIIFWFAISFPPPLNYPVDIDKGVGCRVAFKWRGGQGWNLLIVIIWKVYWYHQNWRDLLSLWSSQRCYPFQSSQSWVHFRVVRVAITLEWSGLLSFVMMTCVQFRVLSLGITLE